MSKYEKDHRSVLLLRLVGVQANIALKSDTLAMSYSKTKFDLISSSCIFRVRGYTEEMPIT